MVFNGKRKRTTRKRPYRAKRGRRAPYRKKGALKRAVHKILDSKLEVKHATQNGNANFNSAANSYGDCINLLPDIQNGTGNAQRIGCKIKPRGLYVKGYFQTWWADNDIHRSRIGLRVVVGMPCGFQEISSAMNLNQDWLPEIIDNGYTTSGLDGSIDAFMGKINRRRFTPYYDKRFYLTQPYSHYFSNDPLDPVTDLAVSSDLHKSTKFFNFKIPFKQEWEYAQEDNGPVSSTLAANHPTGTTAPSQGVQFPLKGGAIMLVSYCFLDGSASTIYPSIQGFWHSDLYYTDA